MDFGKMIIDVHAHLDFMPEEKIKEIQKNPKIKIVVTNSIDKKSWEKNFEIHKKYSKIKLAVGLYPERELKENHFKDFEKFVKENKKDIIALGEIGLDLYECEESFEIQKKIFIKELSLAQKINLPVIIHSRKAEKEVLDFIEKFPKLKVVLHCFSGNFKLIKRAVELGCYFSIPANIVRSEHFQKMVAEIPKERILTETDSPYLSPFVGIDNKPAFIEESIKKISEIWNTPTNKVEGIIEENFNCLFSQ